MSTATTTPGKALLSPKDHTLALIDFESQMAFAVLSTDPVSLRNNAALISKTAHGFGVSTILTTIAEKSFSGPTFPDITDALPGVESIDRTSMNSWEDANFVAQVNAFGKKRVVLAGLWTSVCIVGPALTAIDQGFEVYVIVDACGDISTAAHESAMQRMIQAGVRPLTSLQYLLELQRDWARTETYELTTSIALTHGGGYGLGLQYAGAMLTPEVGH